MCETGRTCVCFVWFPPAVEGSPQPPLPGHQKERRNRERKKFMFFLSRNEIDQIENHEVKLSSHSSEFSFPVTYTI